MKNLLMIKLVLVAGVISLNAQEQQLASLKGISRCLNSEASQLAEQVPFTLKEKTALFVNKHDRGVRRALQFSIGASTMYMGILANQKSREMGYNDDTKTLNFFDAGVAVATSLAIGMPASRLFDKIKRIPILSDQIEEAEQKLKRNSGTLHWANKQIEEFFSVDAKGSNISCNDRGKFLESLKNSVLNDNDIEHRVYRLNCLIVPTLESLTNKLKDLSDRLNLDDVRYAPLDELRNELNVNLDTIKVLLGNADGFEELVEQEYYAQELGEDIQVLFS